MNTIWVAAKEARPCSLTKEVLGVSIKIIKFKN